MEKQRRSVENIVKRMTSSPEVSRNNVSNVIKVPIAPGKNTGTSLGK